jgi:dual specificity MAP kinase phosphatase
LVDGPGNKQFVFDAAVECVEKALRNKQRVLVHCVSGKSRSVTVAALALSRVSGKRFTDTLEHVRACRHCEERQPHPAVLALTGL